MKKECILHIGFPKTASSSIQDTLAKNISLLEEQGYVYPIIDLGVEYHKPNHSWPILSLFREAPDDYHMNVVMGRSAEENNALCRPILSGYLDEAEKIILSGEEIPLLGRKGLKRLKLFLSDKGYSIRVIAYIRAPYSYHCSYVSNHIITGRSSKLSEELFIQSPQIEDVLKEFPETEFYPFAEVVKHEDGPVGHFLDLIGIVKVPDFLFHRRNDGVGNKTVRVVNEINRAYPALVNGKVSDLRKGIIPLHRLEFDDKKFCLTQGEYDSLSSLIAEENRRLEEMLGSEFCDRSFDVSEVESINQAEANTLVERAQNMPSYIRAFIYDYLKDDGVSDQKLLSSLFLSSPVFLDADADIFRDTALMWEREDIETALFFMKIAHEIRPAGPYINKKIDEYTKKLDGGLTAES